MKLSEAYRIIDQLDSDDITDEQKRGAVERMAYAPTHNGVTKEQIIGALRWYIEDRQRSERNAECTQYEPPKEIKMGTGKVADILLDIADIEDKLSEMYHSDANAIYASTCRVAAGIVRLSEPRVLSLEEIKANKICWIEDNEGEIVYPAIYDCVGNEKFSVFTVITDSDVLPEEIDDDIAEQFEEGSRWLWNSVMGSFWRCWTARPTDEQREATPWEK